MIRQARKRSVRPPPVPQSQPGRRPSKPSSRMIVVEDTPPDSHEPPLSAIQLVKIGSALAELDAKPNGRVVDLYHEELTRALPTMTRAELEAASPSLVLTLFNDKLRRAYLDRCLEVGAGMDIPSAADSRWADKQAPDVKEFNEEMEARRKRLKHLSNIYTTELSVRKETFSFYASLGNEMKMYLDSLHEAASSLPAEEPSNLARQVGSVLEQLGVDFELSARQGPVCLHICAQGTNLSGSKQVVYECVDSDMVYHGTHTLTPSSKLRHRLIERMGFKLTMIYAWEWLKLSESERVNTVVKLHSY